MDMLPTPGYLRLAGDVPQRQHQASPSATPTQRSSTIPESNLKWNKLEGPIRETLLREMKTMYWNGVKRELANILLTLHAWQQPKFAKTVLPDENFDFIHGFDTFIDQVSQSSRDFAERYVEKVQRWRGDAEVGWEKGLMDLGMDFEADLKSQKIKTDVREALSERKTYTIDERRARMLLQSAGFLDIDKLVEYRPPEESVTNWKRPVAPQLTSVKSEGSYMPKFIPLNCSRCEQTIRGSMFKRTQEEIQDVEKRNEDDTTTILCETCYRDYHYGDPNFIKSYKHCVLRDAIGVDECQDICHCSSVVHIHRDGRYRQLFPVKSDHGHRQSKTGIKGVDCGLLNLGLLVAEAKYEGMLSEHEKRVSLIDQRRENEKRRKGKDKTKAIEEIPPFLKKFPNRLPFENLHTALRIGPLVIKNGVEHVQGALITSRDMPNLQTPHGPEQDTEYSVAISGDTERSLYSQYITDRKPKRYRAIMKQVAGGFFSGLPNMDLEEQIVQTLIHESRQDYNLSLTEKRKLLDQSTNTLLDLIKQLLEPRVDIYLQSVASKLGDPGITLEWNGKSNNCEAFCESIIDHRIFGSFVPPSFSNINCPLYLMSFVTRPSQSIFPFMNKTKNKYSVPTGHLEEYFHAFHYGRPTDSDLIDALSEYWYDWGAFGSPIYKYGHVFPWDCTEAYGRYPTTCSDCNIAKHVWAFPFDSFSISALHLTRDRYLYPPLDSEYPHPLTDTEWMENRLTILLAQDLLLTVAAAMISCPSFRKATAWLDGNQLPDIERLKLGGIHRAQPSSHAFERGEYLDYFTANWVCWDREEQIRRYELRRDGRMKLLDLPMVPKSLYHDEDVIVGIGACVGIVPACGGGCGEGTCAVSCGGDGGGCGGCGGDG